MRSLLEDNETEVYSISNEGMPLVAEPFIATLNNKICKYKQ